MIGGSGTSRRQKAGPGSRPVFCLAHAGPSMNPTLRELDLLEVVPYDGRPVKPGDVVAAVPPGRETHIVHRVIRVRAEGMCTRGDNNPVEDSWRLQPSHIAGRVVAAWRGQRRWKVSGGVQGRLVARLAGARLKLDAISSRCLRPIYNAVAERGLLLKLVPSSFAPRVMRYRPNGHVRLRLQLHGRLIGEYDPRAGGWRIRRPFRLLIDKDTLPYEHDVASNRP